MSEKLLSKAQEMPARFVDNPCRGIILGLSPEEEIVQVSHVMGRSENSQNRVYEHEGAKVWTAAADPSKMKDPSLIIYNAMRSEIGAHVVSNGDQTDTVVDFFAFNDGVASPGSFYAALATRYCEPDAPTFTPRITGYQIEGGRTAYLAILKADPAARELWTETVKREGLSQRAFEGQGLSPADAKAAFDGRMAELTGLERERFPTVREYFEMPLSPGFGYALTTYRPGSKALPSFEGEPFPVLVNGSLDDVLTTFWNVLDERWRVAMAGKRVGDNVEVKLVNQYERVE